MPLSPRSYSHTLLLYAFADALKAAFQTPNKFKSAKYQGSYKQYQQTTYYLQRKGSIEIVKNEAGQKFLKLTAKGELDLLMAKAWLQKKKLTWDGKWRLIFFDIPEDAKEKRDKLRRLLKNNNFTKLQASVYISPYPLNREAILYLKQTGLITYIRIGRLEELDDDKNLIKHFNLTRSV